MNTPNKYPRTNHWPDSQTIHDDDKTHGDPEFFVGKRVVITEKLDGGNTCLFQGKAYARSVTQEAGAGWFAMVKKHHAWKTTNIDRYAYYGEDLAAEHSIKYTVNENETFRLFAVLDMETNVFLSWEDVVLHAIEHNFLTVPVIHPGGVFSSTREITEWFETAMKYGSEIKGEGCEGFVMRLEGSIEFDQFHNEACKYVRANHVQTDRHWTKNWQWNNLT